MTSCADAVGQVLEKVLFNENKSNKNEKDPKTETQKTIRKSETTT